ncbi:MAG: hypothetical protein R3B93_27465 [Bacteroidia bacterium]
MAHPLWGNAFVGTLFGVLVIPGLYYFFGKMVDGKSIIRDEAHILRFHNYGCYWY